MVWLTWIVGSSPTMTFLGMVRGKERKSPLGLIPPQFCNRVKLGQNLLPLPQGEKFFCFGEGFEVRVLGAETSLA